MKKPRRQILTGLFLLQALKAMRPNYQIKMIVGDKVFYITVKMAVSIARTASYQGEFRNGRVFKMREFDLRRSNAHDSTFRDGRACLQFIAITNKTVDLWDQINANLQQPIPVQVP